MLETNEFFESVIDGLRNKKTVVFCGAGISINSQVPQVFDLVEFILESLEAEEKEKEAIFSYDFDEGKKFIKKMNMPFEAFMSLLQESSDIEMLLDVFDGKDPNPNHYFLAKLLKAGNISAICTTNFDGLIEKALRLVGMMEGRDFKLISDDLGTIDWDDEIPKVIKIHGSISNKKRLGTTLREVAGKTFVQPRFDIIKRLFSEGSHENVLVLGYSCSDVFDISPQIEALNSPFKKILFVQHDLKATSCFPIKEEKEKNPFRKFKEGWRFYCKTDDLVERSWGALSKSEPLMPEIHEDHKETFGNHDWRKFIKKWLDGAETKSGNSAKHNILGMILSSLSQYEMALKRFDLAVNSAPNDLVKAICLGNLGNTYSSKSDFETALNILDEAIDISGKLENKKRELASHKGSKGAIFLKMGNFRAAVDELEFALTIAKEIGNGGLKENFSYFLALAYRNLGLYQEAMDYAQQSLDTADEYGRLHNQVAFLAFLGNVHLERGQYADAIDFINRAYSICENLGDLSGQENQMANLGNICRELQMLDKATEFHQKALKFSRDRDDNKGIQTHIANLASVKNHRGQISYMNALQKLKNASSKDENKELNSQNELKEGQILLRKAKEYFEEAINDYDEALEKAKDLKDLKGQIAHLQNVGGILNMRGQMAKMIGDEQDAKQQFHKAQEKLMKVIETAKEIEARFELANCYGNIGNLYFYMEEYEKSIESCQEAINLCRNDGADNKNKKIETVEYKRCEVNALGNMANSQLSLGKNNEGIELLKRAKIIFQEIGDFQSKQTCINNLKAIYGQMGKEIDFDLESNIESKDDNDLNGEKKKQIEGLVNLAKAYAKLGVSEKIKELIAMAETIYVTIDDENFKVFSRKEFENAKNISTSNN